MASEFSSAAFLDLARANSLRFGQPLTVHAQTASTNDDALSALKTGAPVGALFVAETQTSGRGRQGRHWFSVPGESLTFSLILRPRVAPEQLSAVTLVVGLAAHDALSKVGAHDLKIKWPNDIVHGRKKLLGILVEKPSSTDKYDTALVVGVGVNVGSRAIPPELASQATALDQLLTALPSREHLLSALLQQIERRLGQFEQQSFAALLPEIRAHDALFGERVEIEARQGTARGIGDGGELLLDGGGKIARITAGTVSYT
jgi:BirA family biotin operon repressor/biotin-[acetyl-CoA-carboxylase] ligase